MRRVVPAIATIYYLNWDRESAFDDAASEFFHDLATGSLPDTLDQHDFDVMYRKVRELAYELDGPEALWPQWNRGSNQESQDFLSTRYCDPCNEGFTSLDVAYHHFYHDHYQPPETSLDQFFEYIQGVRSMSVGDIVEIDDTYFMAASIGWQEIEFR